MPIFIDGISEAIGAMPQAPARLLCERRILRAFQGGGVLSGVEKEMTAELDAARDILEEAGFIGPVRNEEMAVTSYWDGPVLGCVDRSALRIFGFLGTKVHVNGIVQDEKGRVHALWLARRAANRRAAPLHLDTMVAGGQPWDKSIAETVIMEAHEEAGLDLARKGDLAPSLISFTTYVSDEGFHRERLAIFDIVVSDAFVPVCLDGEISETLKVEFAALPDLLAGSECFKPNSRTVCIDLLRRHAGGLLRSVQALNETGL